MSTSDAPGDQRRLEEFVDRCEAYAGTTGERCRRDAVAPFPYCGDYLHLLDAVDKERMGLKPPKSDG